MERIALARKYRVAEWLRNAYLELTKQTPLDFEELRPAEPHSNPLVDRTWEATSRDWETLARILYLQTKVAASTGGSNCHCRECDMDSDFYRPYPGRARLCDLRLLAMVDEAFRGELESLRENPGQGDHPFIRTLSLSYLCLLKTILYSQQHRQHSSHGEWSLPWRVGKPQGKSGAGWSSFYTYAFIIIFVSAENNFV